MNDERVEIVNTVLKDGRNLSRVSARYQDDFIIVCAAILGRDYGGVSVLQYASPRLQNNPGFWNVLVAAKKLYDLRMDIMNSSMSNTEKATQLAEIEIRRKKTLQLFANEYKMGIFKETEVETVRPKFVFNDKLKKVLNQGLLGSKINYDNEDYLDNLATGIYLFLGSFIGKDDDQFKMIDKYQLVDFFSREFSLYGISIRKPIIEYYDRNQNYLPNSLEANKNNITEISGVPKNIILAIDILRLCLLSDNTTSNKNKKIQDLLNSIDKMLVLDELSKSRVVNITPSMDSINETIRTFDNISINDIFELLSDYCKSLNIREVFNNENIVIEEVTDSCRSVLSNIDSFALLDSFNGTLLDGKIQVSSDRGYRYHPEMVQQDAVGSAVIDDNHFINIVADGVGGSLEGQEASRILVDEILKWYKGLTIEEASNIYSLSSKLESIIYRADEKIYKLYKGSALTTFVLALTVGEETLIMNIGDSTCYTYNSENDSLVELSSLDSLSNGLSYEDARHNPTNNRITAAIGSVDSNVHMRVIDNTGQRIILSSDGVTDLISEEHFKNYFRDSRVKAEDIVRKANIKPDVNSFMKSEDNISAIVVDLPNMSYERRR